MKSIIYRAAASEHLLDAARRRFASRGVTVFMYHDIGDDVAAEDAWQIVRKSDFRAQVHYLREHYDVISLDEACDRVRTDRHGPRPAAVLTFDDGLIGNHTHLLPMVREFRVPVVVYVATEQVERQALYWFDRIANLLQGRQPVWLDLGAWGLGRFEVRSPPGAQRWAEIQRVLMAVKSLDPNECERATARVQEQVAAQNPQATAQRPLAPMTIEMIRALAAEPLVTLGGHSHGHEVLPLLSLEEARSSVQTGKETLEAWIGSCVRHFAFPAGRNDAATRALVAELGFHTAMGTQNGVWDAASDPLAIPRISVGRYDDLRRFKVHAAGGLAMMLRGKARALTPRLAES